MINQWRYVPCVQPPKQSFKAETQNRCKIFTKMSQSTVFPSHLNLSQLAVAAERRIWVRNTIKLILIKHPLECSALLFKSPIDALMRLQRRGISTHISNDFHVNNAAIFLWSCRWFWQLEIEFWFPNQCQQISMTKETRFDNPLMEESERNLKVWKVPTIGVTLLQPSDDEKYYTPFIILFSAQFTFCHFVKWLLVLW